MSVADEATSAHLQAQVHPFKTMGVLPLKLATQKLNKCFEKWGLPEYIKIDNGFPFVNPKYPNIPTKAKLWWIGLGIQVIQNKPRRPQQNGVVECLQGILHSWSNPKGQSNIEMLQKRVDEESEFQRKYYRMPNKKNKTRLELYPQLESNKRRYDPNRFDINLVYQYLSKQVWTRRLSKFGELSFFNETHYIGKKFARQQVTVTFDLEKQHWIIRSYNGTFLKPSTIAVPQKNEILNFAIMSMNSDTT